MTTFAQRTKEPRPPAHTLVLEPWVFADEWDGKPKETVCVGLRLMSEADKSKARSEGERLASELHPRGGDNWIDAFNDCLVRQVAALCLCDPNDVTRPSQVLPYAEEQVRFALTSRGAKFIFQEFERYEIQVSALQPEASDDELEELAARLAADSDVLSVTARRLLRHVLDELRAETEDEEAA